MISFFKKIYKKQLFQPNILGVFTNPFFITRRAIYVCVKKASSMVSGKILDVGCGQKPYQNLFAKKTSYIGMDVEISGHDHENEDVDVFYDGENFPFQDRTFDSVICNQVLEHVSSPNKILSEMNRVLSSDGILLLSVPFIADEHEQPYDFFRYTIFGIKNLLEKNGFKILQYKNIALVFSHLWVTFLYKKTKTKYPIISLLLTPILFAPFLILGKLFSLIIPNSEDIYTDLIIIAKANK